MEEHNMFDTSLQSKIVAAAMFHGLGQRRFPMFNLLNAANGVSMQQATGQMFNISEWGAVPVPQPGQQPVQPVESQELTTLTSEVKALRNEIDKLVSHSKRQHARISDVEKAVIGNQAPSGGDSVPNETT